MNPLMNIAVLLAGKPKIVHSIAGRLRVNISGVRQFPDYATKSADTCTAILERRAGVTSVSLCLITGNLLVVYDAKKTDEKSIMNWIAAAWKIFAAAIASPSAAEEEEAATVDAIRKKLEKLK